MYDNMIVFMAIVESGTFLQAAKKLKTSQATVSRKLQTLEEELQITLISRNTRDLEITNAGQKLYDELVKQRNSIQNTIDNLRDNNNVTKGRIRVALPIGISYYIISPYLISFIKDNPDIIIEVYYHNHEIDLLKQNFDLAIINHEPKQQTVLIKKLLSIKLHLYCTPEYIQKYGEPKSPQDIYENHTVVGEMNHLAYVNPEITIKHKNKLVTFLTDKTRLFTNTVLHNSMLAASGEAIVGGWDDFFVNKLNDGSIVKVLKDCDFGKRTFYLVRPDVYENATVRKFSKFILECFKRYNKNETIKTLNT